MISSLLLDSGRNAGVYVGIRRLTIIVIAAVAGRKRLEVRDEWQVTFDDDPAFHVDVVGEHGGIEGAAM